MVTCVRQPGSATGLAGFEHLGERVRVAYPAGDQEVVVPPERPTSRQLAVHAQGEEDGRGDGQGPYCPEQPRGVVWHFAGWWFIASWYAVEMHPGSRGNVEMVQLQASECFGSGPGILKCVQSGAAAP